MDPVTKTEAEKRIPKISKNLNCARIWIHPCRHTEGPNLNPGADLSRIFSRGGGGGRILKKISKILTTFFFFPSSPKAVKRPNFLRRRQFFEKTGQKKPFWALFGKL